MRLLAACVLALAERGGAEQEYKYGGVDVTGERIGVMPTNTGVDLSEPNQAYCDGCLSTLESFHIQWLSYVSKESQEGDDVDQKEVVEIHNPLGRVEKNAAERLAPEVLSPLVWLLGHYVDS